EESGKRVDRTVDSTPSKGAALDIGAKTVEKYSRLVEGAATTVANGPLGVFERNGFDRGTREVLESMAKIRGYNVIGGGHLVGLAFILGIDDKFADVCSTVLAVQRLHSDHRLQIHF